MVSKTFLIKSITIKEKPLIEFHEDKLVNTIKVVTDEVIKQMQEQRKENNIINIVLSGGFAQ